MNDSVFQYFIMKRIFIILVYCCFIFYGCQIGNKEANNEYIAIIENTIISTKEVDSIISPQVYQLKKNALKSILRSYIIEIEVKKQKIAKAEFLKRKIESKSIVSIDQYRKYLMDQGLDKRDIDTTKIIEYLQAFNKQKHFEHFADSLLVESNVRINLKPDKFKEVRLDDLDYHELSKGNKIVVYIISDYNCTACQNVEKRLRKIIKTYNQSVSFRFIYFSEYIDKKALIAEAAENQGKFIEFHDFLFDHPELKAENQRMIGFAEKCDMDLVRFEEDMLNPSTLKDLMINKEKITKQNIYVTPSFVINNKLINDEFSLYTLENQINEELEKAK